MSEPSTSSQVSQTPGGSGLDPGAATVAALRQALADGALTAAELTAFYSSRIERLNPVLHAVISVSPQAAAEARASDEARARGAAPGPLAGIPVLIKDNIAVAGMPATAGSPGPRRGRPGRGLPGHPVARGGRGDPRQGQPVRVGELPLQPLHQRVEHARRAGRQPARDRPQPVRIEFRFRGRGRRWPGSARGGHGDRRQHRLPRQRLRDRRHQANPGPGQPHRDRAGLAGAGHRGPDDPVGGGRRRAAVRARRRGPGRPGDVAGGRARLHGLPRRLGPGRRAPWRVAGRLQGRGCGHRRSA